MAILSEEAVYNDNHAMWVSDEVLVKADMLLDHVLECSREKIKQMEDKAYSNLFKKDFYAYDTVRYKDFIPDGDGVVSIKGLFRKLAKVYELEDEDGNNGHLMIVSALVKRSLMWRKGREKYNLVYPTPPKWDVFIGEEKSFFQLFETSVKRRRTSNHRAIDEILSKPDILGNVLRSERPPTREPSRKTGKKQDKPVSVGTSLSEPLAKIQQQKDKAKRIADLEAMIAAEKAELTSNSEIPQMDVKPEKLSKKQKEAAKHAAAQNPGTMGNGNIIPPNAPTVEVPIVTTLGLHS